MEGNLQELPATSDSSSPEGEVEGIFSNDTLEVALQRLDRSGGIETAKGTYTVEDLKERIETALKDSSFLDRITRTQGLRACVEREIERRKAEESGDE